MTKFWENLLAKLRIATPSKKVHDVTNKYTLDMLKLQAQAKIALRETQKLHDHINDTAYWIGKSLESERIR